jgi:hypothetical protein
MFYEDNKNNQSIGNNDSLSKHHHVPLPVQDEDESENSFEDEQNSLLDRLGVKIDDSLHRIFTS